MAGIYFEVQPPRTLTITRPRASWSRKGRPERANRSQASWGGEFSTSCCYVNLKSITIFLLLFRTSIRRLLEKTVNRHLNFPS